MKVGDHAECTRVFSASELRDYATLSGHEISDERVPETLIGALFSYLLGVKLPGTGTMYLKQETRYLQDAQTGEPLSAQVEITRLRPDKHLADLSTTCRGSGGRLIANGRALVYTGGLASDADRHE
jgi:hypothetical protein